MFKQKQKKIRRQVKVLLKTFKNFLLKEETIVMSVTVLFSIPFLYIIYGDLDFLAKFIIFVRSFSIEKLDVLIVTYPLKLFAILFYYLFFYHYLLIVILVDRKSI